MHKHVWIALVLLTVSACQSIDPSPRPLTLAAALPESNLKQKLLSCSNGPFTRTAFSIAHRGAPLGYPEHTEESYRAAARMGAGVIECDVTFTKDLALVCRHSQCDLHRTTNILQTPLANTCRKPFSGAAEEEPAGAQCCTSEITLAEFKSLCGRRDAVNVDAATVDEYLRAPPTKVASSETQCGTLMTHAESIALIDALGADFTPELKSPMVTMPFAGMSKEEYADRLLAEYSDAGIDPTRVHPQSFNIDDVKHWITQHPAFADQVVYLDPRGRNPAFEPTLEGMHDLKRTGVTTLAPPMPMLLTRADNGELQASRYAHLAKAAGLRLITWTFEAGDATDPDNWLYMNLFGYVREESQMLEVLHALAEEAEIDGIFSDWPGTVTYYANCYGL